MESNRCPEGINSLSEKIITVTAGDEVLVCLSNKINELICYISGKEERIARIEAKKSQWPRVSDEMPAPFFLYLVARTTDWFSNCFKIYITQFSHFRIQKNLLRSELLSGQPIISGTYIPPLKYYVYALKKIIT